MNSKQNLKQNIIETQELFENGFIEEESLEQLKLTYNEIMSQLNYAEELANDLKKINIRCITDIRNEKLNYKIRELSNQKINFIGIIGDKEVKNKQVVLRTLGTKNQDVLSVEDFIKKIKISCRIA